MAEVIAYVLEAQGAPGPAPEGPAVTYSTKPKSETDEYVQPRSGLVSHYFGFGRSSRTGPDQTGEFIAKILIIRRLGVSCPATPRRPRQPLPPGQGVCEGGLDLTLRCGFMAAVNRVPECRLIRILVETRQAHRMMVQLARRSARRRGHRGTAGLRNDPAGGSVHVSGAARRRKGGLCVLRTREYAEWQGGQSETPAPTALSVIPAVPAPDFATREATTIPHWRTRLDVQHPRATDGAATVQNRFAAAKPTASTPSGAIRSLVRPLVNSARSGLVAAGVLAPPRELGSRAMKDWLQDLDSHVAMVTVDLQDVGA